MELNGVSAIVTGGGSGMGAATARELASQGAKVAVLDLNAEAAQFVAKEINGFAAQCDVSDANSLEQAFKNAREVHGSARVLVSCAGIAPAKRIVGKSGPMPLDDFKNVIDVNLIGTFNAMRLAAADMINMEPIGADGDRGVIINTASVAAYEGQIGQAAYSASKGAIVSMTLPAAREFAKFGIRVNVIAPGLIGTPLLLNMSEEVQEGLKSTMVYPKRFGSPEEFARLAAHISNNSMLNGEVIRLDGALRMQ